ncbi:hypothetical protein J4526_07040 [Desulfurococcaceae archaeon MEX13E-LK6-19]|nr:hypothetical protein J4526_07040 [Desulfurococcaceae archaeon MEX13E-LK6-19]
MRVIEKPVVEAIALILLVAAIYLVYQVCTSDIIIYRGFFNGYSNLEKTHIEVKGFKALPVNYLSASSPIVPVDTSSEDYYTIIDASVSNIRSKALPALYVVIILTALYTIFLLMMFKGVYVTRTANIILMLASIMLLTIAIPVHHIHSYLVVRNTIYCGSIQQFFGSDEGVLEPIIVYSNDTTTYCTIIPPERSYAAIILALTSIVMIVCVSMYYVRSRKSEEPKMYPT